MAAEQLPLDLGKPTFPRARLLATSAAEATRLGLKRYFTGKPCRRGHVAFRYARDGNCELCARMSYYKHRNKNLFCNLLVNARRRSKLQGITFSLTQADLVCGDSCPCCGQKFSIDPAYKRRRRINPRGPTIDRLIASKGYVAGNVAVICFRCNELKRDATAKELRQIADWLERALSDDSASNSHHQRGP